MSKDTPSAESVEAVFTVLTDTDQMTVEIAEQCELSRSTVRRCLKELFDQGRAERDVVTNGWHVRRQADRVEQHIIDDTLEAATGVINAPARVAAVGERSWQGYLQAEGWGYEAAKRDAAFLEQLERLGALTPAQIRELGVSRWTITRMSRGKHRHYQIAPIIAKVGGQWQLIKEDE